MIIYIYRFITNVFYPFSGIYLWIRIKKDKEIKDRIKERYGLPGKKRIGGNLIWLHASSIGESLSILPLVDEIKKRKNISQILITTGTKTSSDLINDRISGNVIHQFLPLDVPLYVSNFLDYWRPSLAVFVESEIWPNLIIEAKKKGINQIIVNGRMTSQTYTKWMNYPNTAKKIFSCFKVCCTQNSDSLLFFEKLGIKNCQFTGNLKFTSSPKKIDLKIKNELKKKFSGRRLLVAASTHPGEEDEIYKITEEIRKKNPDFLTIIIPRHPNRNNFFTNLNINNIITRSSKEKIKKNTSVYLVDTFGELHIFYSIADFIFIGGSFVDHGGQNPIEAAFYGKIINHGKNIQNFTDVYSVLNQMNITNQVNNSNQLRHYIVSNYSKKPKTSKTENLKKLQSEGKSAMKNVTSIIDQHMPKKK